MTLAGAVAAVAIAAGLVLAYALDPRAALEDPVRGLRQLDLLYLDEPAPLLERLGHRPGEVLVVVVCEGCTAPAVAASVTVTSDAEVAAAYALRRADGRVGPGYALVDGRGRVRYRTFDPGLADHGPEVAVLVAALR